MKIEIAYATPEKQLIVVVDVDEGTTLLDAALSSGIDAEFEGLDIRNSPMGLFGRKIAKPELELVRAGDRIELYRPLTIDPKQARLNRAAKNKK